MRRALAAVVLALACAGCGSEGPARPASAQRAAALPPDAPAELRRIRAQSSELLGGGKAAFTARLRKLRGHPVVVNKWASWCPPCRAEFPYFASQARKAGGRVAFLGVDAQDVDRDARRFLREQPVPYPSYVDPDQEIAGVFGGRAAFPATAFYDREGRLAHLKQGGYPSERKLEQDIARYAR